MRVSEGLGSAQGLIILPHFLQQNKGVFPGWNYVGFETVGFASCNAMKSFHGFKVWAFL